MWQVSQEKLSSFERRSKRKRPSSNSNTLQSQKENRGYFQIRSQRCLVARIPGLYTLSDPTCINFAKQSPTTSRFNDKSRPRLSVKKFHKYIYDSVSSYRLSTHPSWQFLDQKRTACILDFVKPINQFYYLVVFEAFSRWPELHKIANTVTIPYLPNHHQWQSYKIGIVGFSRTLLAADNGAF